MNARLSRVFGARDEAPDAADPSALRAAPVPVVPAAVRRALVVEGDASMAAGRFPRQRACTGGSRLWLPGPRLAFQKGHLAAKT